MIARRSSSSGPRCRFLLPSSLHLPEDSRRCVRPPHSRHQIGPLSGFVENPRRSNFSWRCQSRGIEPLAYALSFFLHLIDSSWPILSTLIVSDPNAGTSHGAWQSRFAQSWKINVLLPRVVRPIAGGPRTSRELFRARSPSVDDITRPASRRSE